MLGLDDPSLHPLFLSSKATHSKGNRPFAKRDALLDGTDSVEPCVEDFLSIRAKVVQGWLVDFNQLDGWVKYDFEPVDLLSAAAAAGGGGGAVVVAVVVAGC